MDLLRLIVPYGLFLLAGLLFQNGVFSITKKVSFYKGVLKSTEASAVIAGTFYLFFSFAIAIYALTKYSNQFNIYVAVLIAFIPSIFGQLIFRNEIKEYKNLNNSNFGLSMNPVSIIIGVIILALIILLGIDMERF